eukprot:14507607-Alexandrium_andersonii.AAC.1
MAHALASSGSSWTAAGDFSHVLEAPEMVERRQVLPEVVAYSCSMQLSMPLSCLALLCMSGGVAHEGRSAGSQPQEAQVVAKSR